MGLLLVCIYVHGHNFSAYKAAKINCSGVLFNRYNTGSSRGSCPAMCLHPSPRSDLHDTIPSSASLLRESAKVPLNDLGVLDHLGLFLISVNPH